MINNANMMCVGKQSLKHLEEEHKSVIEFLHHQPVPGTSVAATESFTTRKVQNEPVIKSKVHIIN